jgi:hypothetical protein
LLDCLHEHLVRLEDGPARLRTLMNELT